MRPIPARQHAWKRWLRPRLRQFGAIVVCAVRGHGWGLWRIETADWWTYVEEPEDYAWRSCPRCHLIERCNP